jgi:hypothetical protein
MVLDSDKNVSSAGARTYVVVFRSAFKPLTDTFEDYLLADMKSLQNRETFEAVADPLINNITADQAESTNKIKLDLMSLNLICKGQIKECSMTLFEKAEQFLIYLTNPNPCLRASALSSICGLVFLLFNIDFLNGWHIWDSCHVDDHAYSWRSQPDSSCCFCKVPS